jgi:hypothetical protein
MPNTAAEKPDAKTIAILYQNDDFGKDYLKGTARTGFGDQGHQKLIMVEILLRDLVADRSIQQIVQDQGRQSRHAADLHRNAEVRAPRPSRRPPSSDWHPVQIPHQRVGLGRRRDASRPAIEATPGRPVGPVSEGRRRSRSGSQRSGHERNGRAFLDQVVSRGRPAPTAARPCLGYGAAQGARARCCEHVRRRPHPRQPDEAGRQPEGLRRPASMLPGTKINTGPDRLMHRSSSCRCMRFKGREMGTVRRHHFRRRAFRVTLHCGNKINRPPRLQSRGLFVDARCRWY